MKVKFEKAFLQAVKKHAGIKKQIEAKVKQIIEHPVELGEPLKGKLRGFYSCLSKETLLSCTCIARCAEKRVMISLSPAQTVQIWMMKH